MAPVAHVASLAYRMHITSRALVLALCLGTAACAHRRPAERPVTLAEGTAEAAFVRRMQSDLRNLVTAQAAFFAERHRYAAQFADLGGGYRTSTDVTVWLLHADDAGWLARARHPDVPAIECRVLVGAVADAPAWAHQLTPGTPGCFHIASP